MQKINPMQYIAVAIANHYGLDKLSWDERINWVKTNMDNLENLVPSSPKTKYLYIKAVKALRDSQAGKPTGYIMDLDASCSGVQIMAVLGKCKTSASTCNLINTGKREDTYTSVLSSINGVNITRTQIKEAIVPMLYGSKAKPRELFGEGTKELKAFNQAVYKTIPILSSLKQLADECWNSNATVHRFTMPDGHVVKLPTLITRGYSFNSGKNPVFYSHKEIGISSNSTPLLSAIVHATDAYVSRQMVRMANKQGFQLAHIHDSYFTSPVYMQQVRENYVHIMYELAKSTLLEDIVEELTGKRTEFEYSNPDLYKEIRYAEYALS
jgi:hypothetical protein